MSGGWREGQTDGRRDREVGTWAGGLEAWMEGWMGSGWLAGDTSGRLAGHSRTGGPTEEHSAPCSG